MSRVAVMKHDGKWRKISIFLTGVEKRLDWHYVTEEAGRWW